MQAIILAGGKGTRLRPYTAVLPKPLMPIGDYPILEIILRQLEYYKFDDIIISTGYLHEIIRAYLEPNKRIRKKNIRYCHEEIPLGTIAPLKLIENLEDTFLVMNGDILTDLNYINLYNYHKNHKGLATIASYKRDAKIDFGVLEYDNNKKIKNFIEKPVYNFHVSMGIYVLNREILDAIPKEGPFGFDNLMHWFLREDKNAYSYPHDGYWLDIGRPDDYEQSIDEFEKNKEKFLP
jgi:NDP-sugar pyrophosphorylase family protein